MARKKPGSSGADRLTPSSTTGPVKARETTISQATSAPISSAYDRALHIPPGSGSTVCWASAGPDSTISQGVMPAG
jgi:hypothetical protein